MILKFPEGRYDALRARLDERIHDVLHSLLANRADSGVAGRQRYKIGIEAKISDLTHLEKAVVPGRTLRCKDERGAIRYFGIDISVKSEVNDVVPA